MAGRYPVILCHGNALNNYFWHLESTNDFGRYLQKRGFDVWLVDLRGHGVSRLENPFAGNYLGDKVAARDPYDWSLEDYAMKDIDAIIREVLRRTQKRKVIWVGHSMGGMIMYLRLALVADERVAGFVAVSSPVVIPKPPSVMLHEIATIPDKNLESVIEKRMMAGILHNIAIFKTLLMTPMDILYYNRDHMPDETVICFYANAVENIPPRVNEQLMAMVRDGEVRSPDGETRYVKMLMNVTTPILCVGGKADELAPPQAIRFAYGNVSSEDKSFHIFGRANKGMHDYGHCDIICGNSAEQEVYPYLTKWLLTRGRVRRAPASRPAGAPSSP